MGLFKQVLDAWKNSPSTVCMAAVFAVLFYLNGHRESLDIFGTIAKERIIWCLDTARGASVTLGLIFAANAGLNKTTDVTKIKKMIENSSEPIKEEPQTAEPVPLIPVGPPTKPLPPKKRVPRKKAKVLAPAKKSVVKKKIVPKKKPK